MAMRLERMHDGGRPCKEKDAVRLRERAETRAARTHHKRSATGVGQGRFQGRFRVHADLADWHIRSLRL